MAGRQPQPTAKVLDARPAAHIGPNLAQDDQGGLLLEAFKRCEVDAGHTRERGAHLEAWRMRFPLALAGFRWQGLAPTLVRKRGELRRNLRVARRQLMVVELIQLDRLA